MSVVIDYRTRCKAGAERVYKEIVKLKCTHKRASTSWEALQKQHTITCNSAVSLSLQQAGCLKPGKLIGHVATTGRTLYSIRTPDQAMYGRSNLSHCRYVWCGCKYDELPAWLKRGGIVYIQWSNACVSAGGGWVWSCNQQGGFHQGHYTEYKGGVLADHGTYPFGGRIFLAIVPEDKWLQHYAVEAVLPAGTLSGAPKIRACQLIAELENNKRGVYGGAIGYVDFTGNMDACIAIRIMYKKNGKVFVRSGAGIVADSVPSKEYEECINKAKASLKALELAQEVDL